MREREGLSRGEKEEICPGVRQGRIGSCQEEGGEEKRLDNQGERREEVCNKLHDTKQPLGRGIQLLVSRKPPSR